MFELSLPELIEQPETQCEFPIRWAKSKDVKLLSQMGWSEPRIRHLMDDGALVALVERDGRLIACLLLEINYSEPNEWLQFELKPCDLWVAYTWVSPEARGQGLFSGLRRFVAHDCSQMGFTRILNAIGLENVKALRANAKLPTRRIGQIVYMRTMGLTIVLTGGRIHLGWWGPGRRLKLSGWPKPVP